MVGIAIPTLALFIKYKPSYKVSISGEEMGYVNNKQAFEEDLKTAILNTNEKQENIDAVEYNNEPKYELGLVTRKEKTKEVQIAQEIKDDIDITYKYYEIDVSDVPVDSVNTLADAENLVNQVKEEEKDKKQDLDLSIVEKYTSNAEEIKTNKVETAKENVTSKIAEEIVTEQLKGVISSRFGASSSIRKSTHTGLDIACAIGTPIKVTSDGTVVSAQNEGSYGNLVKVGHGNGIETWYAHTSKMYVKAGQQVKAGDVIAAVGSTGNSTGPHLHLEIRVNGVATNPQKYLYK